MKVEKNEVKLSLSYAIIIFQALLITVVYCNLFESSVVSNVSYGLLMLCYVMLC